MIHIHPQYLVDGNQQRKAVLISIEEWGQIVDELEELEDVRMYEQAKAGPQNAVPFEQAVRELGEGNKP